MAKGFKHGAGGSNPLNFKVICNPQPQTAKENTIWVDTNRINNHYFSATQPENMAEYDVWFAIGASSNVAFSATKKNPIMVYPLSAKQLISGVLVDKTARIYQGGAWADWIDYLFYYGNTFNDITGGFYKKTDYGTATIDSSGMHLTGRGSHDSAVGYETKNNIDLSKCKTLCVERNFQSVSGGYFHVNLYDINGNQALHMNSHDNGTTIEKIDVASLNGSYRIYVHVYTYQSSAVPVADVTRIWRE